MFKNIQFTLNIFENVLFAAIFKMNYWFFFKQYFRDGILIHVKWSTTKHTRKKKKKKKEGKKAYNINNPWKTVDRESNLLYLIIYTNATVSSQQKYFTHYSAEKRKRKRKNFTHLWDIQRLHTHKHKHKHKQGVHTPLLS